MTARFTALIICSAGIFFSCNNQSKNSSESIADTTANLSGVENAFPQLTKEEAETIVSKYFSEKNGEKGYIRYKGLFLDIDSIIHSENDQSAVIISTITGRESKDQADTASVPFVITDSFRLKYNSNNWTIDK